MKTSDKPLNPQNIRNGFSISGFLKQAEENEKKVDDFYNPFKEPKNKIIVYDMEKGLKALKSIRKRLKSNVKDKDKPKKYYLNKKQRNKIETFTGKTADGRKAKTIKTK